MRILQVLSRSSCSSGGSIQALILSRGLKERGHDVVFVSKGGKCGEKAQSLGVRTKSVKMKWNPKGVYQFVRLFLEEKPHVVHAHKGKALSFSIISSFATGIGKVFANRGVSFPLTWSNRWKYKLPVTYGIICVSFGIKRQLARSGINPEKVYVVYGSLDDRFFRKVDKGDAIKKLNLKDDIYIALVGNFRPWKGHTFLAEAFEMAGFSHRVKLLFAGNEKKNILQKVSNITQNFVSLGYREDVEYVIASSSVLVNASFEGEGIPGVLREAMALGVPVVASNLEGNREMVRHGKNGLIFDLDSTDALKRCLRLVLSNRKFSKIMGINGARFAKRFNTTNRIKIIERIYKKGTLSQ